MTLSEFNNLKKDDYVVYGYTIYSTSGSEVAKSSGMVLSADKYIITIRWRVRGCFDKTTHTKNTFPFKSLTLCNPISEDNPNLTFKSRCRL